MTARRFRSFRFAPHQFAAFFAPRKPRHRVLRVLLTVLGLGLLAMMLVFGLFIGATMLAIGLAFRLWRRRGKPVASARDARVMDGEYRVVRKPALSSAR